MSLFHQEVKQLDSATISTNKSEWSEHAAVASLCVHHVELESMSCGRTGAGQGQRRVGVQGHAGAGAGAVREPGRRRDRGAVLGMVSRREARAGSGCYQSRTPER